MNSLTEKYRKLFKSPIFFLFMAVYSAGAIVYVTYTQEKKRKTEISLQKAKLEREIDKLQMLINENHTLKIKHNSTLFKDIEIRDSLDVKGEQANFKRILEYAQFALDKEDYEYAERFYQDGINSYKSSVANYYLARLYYIQNKLKMSEIELNKAILKDSKNIYPEYNFYLAVINFELDKRTVSKDLLREYLKE